MGDSAIRLRHLLRDSGINPESDIARRMIRYLTLLEKWNPRINLTASIEWSGIGPLFQEAVWASGFYPDTAKSHLDIGSGAGFPAIPLRLLLPQIKLEMVESRLKRSVFLETVSSSLGLEGTRIHNMRLDEYLRSCRHDKTWDCISWKGLKLGNADLEALRKHKNAQTQFWMFHGSEPAVEGKEFFEGQFELIRREKFPGGRTWFLSIYGSL